jgi:hypothetical protein
MRYGTLGWEVTHGFDDFLKYGKGGFAGIGNGVRGMEVTTFASVFLLCIAWSGNEIEYVLAVGMDNMQQSLIERFVNYRTDGSARMLSSGLLSLSSQ